MTPLLLVALLLVVGGCNQSQDEKVNAFDPKVIIHITANGLVECLGNGKSWTPRSSSEYAYYCTTEDMPQ